LVYVGLKSVGMRRLVDWNPNRKSVWYGPTSTTRLLHIAAENFARGPGMEGVVFEVRLPLDWKHEWTPTDSGLITAFSIGKYRFEDEVLVWNIKTEWMIPVIINGKWAVTDYFPYRGKLGLETLPDAISTENMYYVARRKTESVKMGFTTQRIDRAVLRGMRMLECAQNTLIEFDKSRPPKFIGKKGRNRPRKKFVWGHVVGDSTRNGYVPADKIRFI